MFLSSYKLMTVNCVLFVSALPGQHYFLGMNSTSECNDFQGVFLLYDDEELIGVGLIPFGSYTNGEREWFEDPSVAAVQVCI